MLNHARLDLVSAFLRFIGPDQESIDGANFAMCLSLFDDPNRSGKLAELRRQSRAKTLCDLQEYVMHAGLTEADNRELWADVDARLERQTLTTDLERVIPDAVRLPLACWLTESRRSAKRIKA